MGWFSKKKEASTEPEIKKPSKYETFVNSLRQDTAAIISDEGKVNVPVTYKGQSCKLTIYKESDGDITIFNPLDVEAHIRIYYTIININDKEGNKIRTRIDNDSTSAGPRSYSRVTYHAADRFSLLITSIVKEDEKDKSTLLWSGKALLSGKAELNELFG